MKKEDKDIVISQIKETVASYSHFYLTEAQGLNAEQVSKLRRLCNKREVKMLVVKNTLFRKALESLDVDYSPIYDSLKNNTAVLFSNTGNVPAKLIKEFSKDNQKPVLKAAYVEECFYIGENQLEALAALKSKNELIGDIIALLQSPAKNVVSALQSGGTTIHGVLKTLSER
ncbi:MAG: 50S ribosomal protein L10 [Sphingobacteriia bacterium]|jgi:large subunit ribosomal protein L10|nr:50S ribosomal protein L10 [Paludibacteraceae bacterium]NCA78867.1 50S ribosomal protein L10 [Sphingobacteriia bacterium]